MLTFATYKGHAVMIIGQSEKSVLIQLRDRQTKRVLRKEVTDYRTIPAGYALSNPDDV
jgi:hypothetical protein